jgi:hypothetical protein
MNTKLLMVISAVVLGVSGIILTFMPEEVSRFLNLTESISIVLQILGALLLWICYVKLDSKGNLTGGIYSKPVAIGNFSHFLIGGLALIKLALHNLNWTSIWVCAILYLIFALLFGWVLFTNPASAKKTG